MAGTIKHTWNGTVLTVTSDSGTSSMDLKGSQGDMGPRGPQGPAGISVGGGDGGNAGIYVGETEPSPDDNVMIWINPEGTASESESLATIQYVYNSIAAIFTFDPTTGRLDITT